MHQTVECCSSPALPERYSILDGRFFGIGTNWLQAKKVVNYAESGDENDDEDEEVFIPTTRTSKTKPRVLKRRKTKEASDEEDYSQEAGEAAGDIDEGLY